MPVAKSYQKLATFGEPFAEKGRMYITVVTERGAHKKVRWYTDAEYAKLYPQDEAAGYKKLRSRKDVLGFSKGYITILKGNTSSFTDWLKENGAVYRTFWGWSFASDIELPEMPHGLEAKQLLWESVAYVDEDELKPQTAIDEAVAALIYEAGPSEWQGELGDRIERTLTVTKVVECDGYYGASKMFIFKDEEENIYVWNTATKDYEEGQTISLRGTIKELSVFRNTKQTVLTRCKEI